MPAIITRAMIPPIVIDFFNQITRLDRNNKKKSGKEAKIEPTVA